MTADPGGTPAAAGGRTPNPGEPGRDAASGWTLALGGGGSLGIAFMSGVLTALGEAGVRPASADLVIGTSGGAVAGAALRKGLSPELLLSMAKAAPDDERRTGGRQRHYEPAWDSLQELVRRCLGAGAVMARSYLRAPVPVSGQFVQDRFPGGLFRPRNERLASELGATWPDDPLWLMAVDLRTGRRVPLGREPADRRHPLHAAVMASCTVPGFYEPVRLGDRLLVDGGIRSSTSIDYAVRHGSRRVVAIVPLGWELPGRPPLRHRLIRRSTVTGTRRELARVGDRSRDVLVIQPMAEDVERHGSNIMRTTGLDAIAELAYDRTHTALGEATMEEFLTDLQHPHRS